MSQILIVDDDEAFLETMKDGLGEQGYEVVTCDDPRNTLSLIHQHPVQFILLDYHMPHLDGEDLLHIVHSKYPAIPVILCSGFIEKEEELFRQGAYEILNKPFNLDILLKVLARASGREEETLDLVIAGYNLRLAHETLIRKLTIKALGKTGYNVTRAARLLGITRQCLIRYINRYHLR